MSLLTIYKQNVLYPKSREYKCFTFHDLFRIILCKKLLNSNYILIVTENIAHINKICNMTSSFNYFNSPVWFSMYVHVLPKQEVMCKLPYMHKESWYVCIAHHLKNVTNWMEVETQLAKRFVLLCTQINARVMWRQINYVKRETLPKYKKC